VEGDEEGEGERCYCLEGAYPSIKTLGNCPSGVFSLSRFRLGTTRLCVRLIGPLVLTTFLFALLLSLSFFGPMVAYLTIIYKRTTKHKENQEKARQIRAGDCTERRLWRNWRSPAVHLTYPVASLPVREPVRFLFWFYVLEPICSRWEPFDNRGSAVYWMGSKCQVPYIYMLPQKPEFW
jgi:hypothetical protein